MHATTATLQPVNIACVTSCYSLFTAVDGSSAAAPPHTQHTHNPSLRLQSKQNYARMSCRCRNEQQRQERAAEAGTCMPLLVERASVGAPNIYLAMN